MEKKKSQPSALQLEREAEEEYYDDEEDIFHKSGVVAAQEREARQMLPRIERTKNKTQKILEKQQTKEEKKLPSQRQSYCCEKVSGQGAFGTVYKAKCLETGETFAVKKIKQDNEYKSRELELLQTFTHPNIINLKDFFVEKSDDYKSTYLNLVTDFYPETLSHVLNYVRVTIKKECVPMLLIRLYTFQLLRALTYLHGSHQVAHRDIKPQNLLIDPNGQRLALCDFGSAKKLSNPKEKSGVQCHSPISDILGLPPTRGNGESPILQPWSRWAFDFYPLARFSLACTFGSESLFSTLATRFNWLLSNLGPRTTVMMLICFGLKGVLYISTRYYRAPELLLCSEHYGVEIDLWAAGCVLAEMLRGGRVLFEGKSNADQLAKVMMLFGTPTESQAAKLNNKYNHSKMPYVDPQPISNYFPPSTPKEAIDLVLSLLNYDPDQRLSAARCLAHPFFNPLRDEKTTLADGSPLPKSLFDFTEEELQYMRKISGGSKLIESIIPRWQREQRDRQNRLKRACTKRR